LTDGDSSGVLSHWHGRRGGIILSNNNGWQGQQNKQQGEFLQHAFDPPKIRLVFGSDETPNFHVS
jgi:hypothetical protein